MLINVIPDREAAEDLHYTNIHHLATTIQDCVECRSTVGVVARLISTLVEGGVLSLDEARYIVASYDYAWDKIENE